MDCTEKCGGEVDMTKEVSIQVGCASFGPDPEICTLNLYNLSI